MYDLKTHIHTFACWTAARASQRGFKTTKEIIKAIHDSNLFGILFSPQDRPIGPQAYDNWHRKTCALILQSLGVDSKTNYGRAAKIVSVYLKTAVLLPEGAKDFTATMHPPIDRILLKNLAKRLKKEGKPESSFYDDINWTQIGLDEYYRLIDRLRTDFPETKEFWKIEEGWTLEDD
jgi:hypothetical protein